MATADEVAARFGAIPKGGTVGGGSLAPGAKAGRVAMCALVLEDNPVGPDSRLEFETFDQELSEAYSVSQYKEMGGERMPQPGYVAYRGGNWQPFNLTLLFYAGTSSSVGSLGTTGLITPGSVTPPDIEQLLIDMESKVRWCQALTFPLERSLGSTGQRILQTAQASGVDPTEAGTEAITNLRRNDPPFVLAIFGSWMVIRGYVTSVDIKWKPPFHPVSARPYGAEVSLAIQPNLIEYPTWQSIRNRAGQGGITTQTPATGDVAAQTFLADQLARIAAVRAQNELIAAQSGTPIPEPPPVVGVVSSATFQAQFEQRAAKRAADNKAAIQKLVGLGSLNTIAEGGDSGS